MQVPVPLGASLALLLSLLAGRAWAGEPLARLDHIPVAVRDLAQATLDYRALGFAIKPGRPHANGLRNAHIKFANGAGLELITATGPSDDALATRYAAFLHDGEGPAYLTLHAPDERRAATALQAAGIPHRWDADGLTLTDPRLAWIFFAADNRSPTDRPEHFAHANGASATREVWVALDDSEALARLLTALGARRHDEMRHELLATRADVFELADGGRVVVVPARHQIVPGHSLIGVVMAAPSGRAGRTGSWPPAQTHGLWLMLKP